MAAARVGTKPLPLEQVLSYRNDELVHRFAEDFHVTLDVAEDLFLETKRWLWLCGHRRVEFAQGRAEFVHVPLLSEAGPIDAMWHTFLLFTKDYAEFCDRHFGFFIHHYPMTRAEKARAESESRETRLESTRKVYEYIYDQLGPETLKKWCEGLPHL